jgi:nucleotide-binding universal stress UspA family protein
MTEGPRIRRILAATDLSECGGRAATLAGMIARATDAELSVVYVHSTGPDYTSRVLAGERTVRELADEKRADTERELDHHLAALPVARRLILSGPAAAGILGAAEEVGADLVVVGTRGQGPLNRALLGSVAEAVILDSHRPVLSVRCGESPLPPALRRIICAVDASAVSRAALDLAWVVASAFNAELSAVSVIDRQEETDEAEERLEAWVRNGRIRSAVVTRDGSAAATLIEFAKERGADLLVTGATRKFLSKKTALGSTATALTHHAHCPVLVVSRSIDAG